MEDNQQGYIDAQKVEKMLENITSSSTEVVALKTISRDRYPNDFAQASTHMAGQIALIFPAAQGEFRNKRRIASMDSRGRGDGPGCGRGRRTTMMSGVDVSDPTGSFTPEEWKKLQEGNHLSYIHEQRNQGSRGHGRGRGRGGRYGALDGGRGGRGGGRQGRNMSLVSLVIDTNENNDENTNASSGTGSGGRGSTRGGRGGVTFGGRRYAQQE